MLIGAIATLKIIIDQYKKSHSSLGVSLEIGEYSYKYDLYDEKRKEQEMRLASVQLKVDGLKTAYEEQAKKLSKVIASTDKDELDKALIEEMKIYPHINAGQPYKEIINLLIDGGATLKEPVHLDFAVMQSSDYIYKYDLKSLSKLISAAKGGITINCPYLDRVLDEEEQKCFLKEFYKNTHAVVYFSNTSDFARMINPLSQTRQVVETLLDTNPVLKKLTIEVEEELKKEKNDMLPMGRAGGVNSAFQRFTRKNASLPRAGAGGPMDSDSDFEDALDNDKKSPEGEWVESKDDGKVEDVRKKRIEDALLTPISNADSEDKEVASFFDRIVPSASPHRIEVRNSRPRCSIL